MNPYKVGILKDITAGLLVSGGGSGLESVTPDLPTFSQITALFSRRKYDDYYDEDDELHEKIYDEQVENIEKLAEEILKTLIDIDEFKENNYQYRKALNDYHSIVAARRHKEMMKVFEDAMKGKLRYTAQPLQIPKSEKSNLPLLLGGTALGAVAFLLPGTANARRIEEEFGFDEMIKEVDGFESEVELAERDLSSLEKETDALLADSFNTDLDSLEKEFDTDEKEISEGISNTENEIKKLEEETSKIKLEPAEVQAPPELTRATDDLQQVEQQVQQLQRDIDKQEITRVAEPVVTALPTTDLPAVPEEERVTLPVPVRPAPPAPVPVPPAVTPEVRPRPAAPAAAALPPARVETAPSVVTPPAPPTPGPRVTAPTVSPNVPVAPPATTTTVRPPVPRATATETRVLRVEDIKELIGKTEGGKFSYNAANVPVLQERNKYSETERREIYNQLFKEAEIVKGNIDVTTGKKFDKNMSEMTIEEVIDLGNRRRAHYANFKYKDKPVKLAITTASGKYGFIAAALEDNGYRLFGENWKKETYSSATQEALQTFLLKTNILRAEKEEAPVSTAFLYMKHFFGPNSTKPLQILNAKDDDRMSDIMSNSQKTSNPRQAKMTVREYKDDLIKKGFSFDIIDTKKLIPEEDRRKIETIKPRPEVNKVTGQKVSDASSFNRDQKITAASQKFVYVLNNSTTMINKVGSSQNTPRQINNNPGLA
jgi:hypothetical protein